MIMITYTFLLIFTILGIYIFAYWHGRNEETKKIQKIDFDRQKRIHDRAVRYVNKYIK